MTGKEALKLLNQITEIYDLLVNEDERMAFFNFGMLTEQLSQIVKIDQVSFNPTVSKDEPF
jgi:hypothetical protein